MAQCGSSAIISDGNWTTLTALYQSGGGANVWQGYLGRTPNQNNRIIVNKG